MLGLGIPWNNINDRPYRAPELIFGPDDYGGEVDIWSFGCTVAEAFTPKNTVFSDGAQDGGLSSDLVLLGSIISTLGTPTAETWPESTSASFYVDRIAKKFRDWEKVQLSEKPALPRENVVPWASKQLIPWIFSMLAISAGQRATASSVYPFVSILTTGARTSKGITPINHQ